MLTDEEQHAFRLSIDRVRHAAAIALRQAGDAGLAVGFVANLHRGLDAVAARTSEQGLVPDCRVGCCYCCCIRVEATDPEVFLIVRRVHQLPDSRLAGLVDRLRLHAEPSPAGKCCPFLEEGLCSIYETRPAVCRKAHSLSARSCESPAPEIPQNLRRLLEAESLMAGTAEAYREVGLPASPHELASAVLTALEDETAEARWYKGGMVFGGSPHERNCSE